MSIELVIDYRENALISLFDPNDIKVESLDLGDIVFREKGDNILIIERKTILDLKASICDGRMREQKARFLGCDIENNHIMYLIEGNMDKDLNSKVSGLPVSTLVGSLINTQLRDGIKVYKTHSIKETINFLVKMKDKLEKDRDKYFNEKNTVSKAEYSVTLKQKKKANMTPEVWFLNQLSMIPQLSINMASEIIKTYPTIFSLIMEYEKTPIHLRCKLLADIKYSLKSGKTRRIGDKISKRVYEFMYGFL